VEQLNIFEMMNEPLTHWEDNIAIGELFSGYGSQMLAIKKLGMNVSRSYIVEIDMEATIAHATLHHHLLDVMKKFKFPTKEEMQEFLIPFGYWKNEKEVNIKRLKEQKLKQLYLAHHLTKNKVNVFNVKGEDLPYVQLFTFSTPCQEFSIGGNRGGFDSLKGSLTFESVRVLKELKEHNKKPLFGLFENVTGIIDKKHIGMFKQFKQELEKLEYEVIPMTLKGSDYSIPQTRNRVFLLLIDKEYFDGHYYNEPKPFDLELKLKDFVEEDVDEKYYLSDAMIDYIMSRTKQGSHHINATNNLHDLDCDSVAGTVTTSGGSQANDNFIVNSYDVDKSIDDYFERKSTFTKVQADMITQDGNIKRYVDSDIVDEFNVGDVADISFPNGYNKGNRVFKEKCPTLNGTTTSSSFIVKEEEPLKIRKLTPKEAGRLMGVSDEDIDKLIEIGFSDSVLFKLFGNSIIVDIMYYIFKNLFKYEEKE